jgi:hypothetical protein
MQAAGRVRGVICRQPYRLVNRRQSASPRQPRMNPSHTHQPVHHTLYRSAPLASLVFSRIPDGRQRAALPSTPIVQGQQCAEAPHAPPTAGVVVPKASGHPPCRGHPVRVLRQRRRVQRPPVQCPPPVPVQRPPSGPPVRCPVSGVWCPTSGVRCMRLASVRLVSVSTLSAPASW